VSPLEQAISDPSTSTPGLRPNILSSTEILAQSISVIAPVTTPVLTIPFVFALAGNGTWFAYLLATVAVLLIALCIGRFARYTSCSGSLYTYATSSLPPVVSSIAGWALLLAYVATAASVAGGFINYANVFAVQFLHHAVPTSLLALVCVGAATWIAYRDVQVSAETMLWIEVASIVFISIVLLLLIVKNGLHLDHLQLSLHGVKASGVRLGVIMAIFSFVGFESATALGAEAVNPLRTIPRAVIQSALFAGIFFVVCCYLETQGMANAHVDLGKSDAPMRVLATFAGVGPLGALIDFGALVSLFACTLACITAAARVLLRMAHNGLVHRAFAAAHHKNATPAAAVLATGIATLLPVVLLCARGIAGIDIYGWAGSLAVYGFLTTYGLAAIALPIYLKRNHQLTGAMVLLASATVVAILLALAGTLYPVPEAPLNWLPYLYLGYIFLGIAWHGLSRRWRVMM
jgi:amino acid transporter